MSSGKLVFEEVARKRANGPWTGTGEPNAELLATAIIDEAIIADSVDRYGGV
jgi:hypothetical protein